MSFDVDAVCILKINMCTLYANFGVLHFVSIGVAIRCGYISLAHYIDSGKFLSKALFLHVLVECTSLLCIMLALLTKYLYYRDKASSIKGNG